MKKLFLLSFVCTAMVVCSSNLVLGSTAELDAFMQHMVSETYWLLGAPAMAASLLGFMILQKGVSSHNQATFIIGAVTPVMVAAVCFLAALFSGSCVMLVDVLFVAFCLTFVPFTPVLVVYLIFGKRFELLRNVYVALYLVCCIAGGLLGAPVQVFIGALLFALLGGYLGELWSADSKYMNAKLVE